MSIKADDIDTGMYVTVLRGPEHYMASMLSEGRWCRDTTHNGKVYRVLAVSYPFVALTKWNGERFFLDLREYDLARVSAAYVRALKPKPKSESDKPATSGQSLYSYICATMNGTHNEPKDE